MHAKQSVSPIIIIIVIIGFSLIAATVSAEHVGV
jgi:hypothetical protein